MKNVFMMLFLFAGGAGIAVGGIHAFAGTMMLFIATVLAMAIAAENRGWADKDKK